MATITFYGGVGTVTGSKYLLEHNGKKVLVDCGLFQGLKEIRERNWQDPPFVRERDRRGHYHARPYRPHGLAAAAGEIGLYGPDHDVAGDWRSVEDIAARFGTPTGRRGRLSQPSRSDEPFAGVAAL